MKNLIVNDYSADELDYIDSEFLADVQSEQLVASTMFDSVFIPSKRIPKSMIDNIISHDNLEQHLLANLPLQQTKITQPYWSKGQNQRPFDSIICEVYGSICLADDRHLLDSIIAHGSMLNNAQNYTLCQFAELAKLDVVWENLPDQSHIRAPLKNHGMYFHIPFSVVCKAIGLKNTKSNRETICQRLHRLSIMQLILNFEKNGERLHNRMTKISLVDKDFYCLLVPSRVKNKKSITPDTVTDLLVNVSSHYLKTLKEDGQISRKRFLNEYKHLNGPHSLVDFFKFIDRHKRHYIHQKLLSVIVADYYKSKMSMFGMNIRYKISNTMELVVNKQEELHESYNFVLKRETDPKKTKNKEDWLFLYLPLIDETETII
jgi:hypothetical protein